MCSRELYECPNVIEEKEMPSDLAMQKAGQAWSRPETKHMSMNTKLVVEFAIILDEYIDAIQWYIKILHTSGIENYEDTKHCEDIMTRLLT